jgi:hypothetical protein
MVTVARETVWQCNMFGASARGAALVDLQHFHIEGGRKVDMTLRLNVLAVLAAVVFVTAILFGAF